MVVILVNFEDKRSKSDIFLSVLPEVIRHSFCNIYHSLFSSGRKKNIILTTTVHEQSFEFAALHGVGFGGTSDMLARKELEWMTEFSLIYLPYRQC